MLGSARGQLLIQVREALGVYVESVVRRGDPLSDSQDKGGAHTVAGRGPQIPGVWRPSTSVGPRGQASRETAGSGWYVLTNSADKTPCHAKRPSPNMSTSCARSALDSAATVKDSLSSSNAWTASGQGFRRWPTKARSSSLAWPNPCISMASNESLKATARKTSLDLHGSSPATTRSIRESSRRDHSIASCGSHADRAWLQPSRP
jgi:hypothetical protein